MYYWSKEASVTKIRSIRQSVLTEHRLVTDTDRQTDRHRNIAIVPALEQRRAGNKPFFSSTMIVTYTLNTVVMHNDQHKLL